MPSTVVVNNLTVVHKDSGGVSLAFPDVCKTPSPAGRVPIPYPNTAMSSDTDAGSKTVSADGNPLMTKASYFSTSTGDEAGSAMGVVSSKTKGKAYPKMYSFDVKADGEAVFRLSDIMLQNGGSPVNTPPATEMQAPKAAMAAGDDPETPEVTDLKWNRDEAVCGDKVILRVYTQKVAGDQTLAVLAHRASEPKAVLDNFAAAISGNRARVDWIARRGPYKKTVAVTARQAQFKGKQTTAKDLTLKAPEQAKETISATIVTPQWLINPATGIRAFTGAYYQWPSAYDIELRPGELVVTRKLAFTLLGGAASPSPRRKRQWRTEIETVWDRKFKIHRNQCQRKEKCDCASRNGCCSWVVRIRAQYASGHGTVNLRKGGNDPNAWGVVGKWWFVQEWWEKGVGVPATVRAHEFGHLMGLYDEYPNGACDPLRRITNAKGSIMNNGSKPHIRHVKAFHKWFEEKAKGVIGATKIYA